MEGSTKFVIGIVVIVLIGLPLMGQLAKKPAATPATPAAQPAPETPAPAPTPAYAPQPRGQAEAAPPPQTKAPRPQPQKPQAPPPPMDLSNTAWTLSHPQYGEITIELFSGGQGVAQGPNLPMQVDGTWVQRGNSLTFTAMGRTISAQLKDGQLMANGMAARRLR